MSLRGGTHLFAYFFQATPGAQNSVDRFLRNYARERMLTFFGSTTPRPPTDKIAESPGCGASIARAKSRTNGQAGIRRERVPIWGGFQLGAISHIKLRQGANGDSSRLPGPPCIPASWSPWNSTRSSAWRSSAELRSHGHPSWMFLAQRILPRDARILAFCQLMGFPLNH